MKTYLVQMQADTVRRQVTVPLFGLLSSEHFLPDESYLLAHLCLLTQNHYPAQGC